MYAESQVKSTNCGDIVAPKLAVDYHTNEDSNSNHVVARYLDWRCRMSSSFIFVFDDRKHAINLAVNIRS